MEPIKTCPVCLANQERVRVAFQKAWRAGKGPTEEYRAIRREALDHWRNCPVTQGV